MRDNCPRFCGLCDEGADDGKILFVEKIPVPIVLANFVLTGIVKGSWYKN